MYSIFVDIIALSFLSCISTKIRFSCNLHSLYYTAPMKSLFRWLWLRAEIKNFIIRATLCALLTRIKHIIYPPPPLTMFSFNFSLIYWFSVIGYTNTISYFSKWNYNGIRSRIVGSERQFYDKLTGHVVQI